MDQADIRWNEEARAKILDDSDRVLREAVIDVSRTMGDRPWEDSFAELNARLKDRFIDFKPGPDLRRFAEAISAGEFAGQGDRAVEGGQDGTPEVPTDTATSSESGRPAGGSDSPGQSVPDGQARVNPEPAVVDPAENVASGGTGSAETGEVPADGAPGNGAPGHALADTSDADPEVNDG